MKTLPIIGFLLFSVFLSAQTEGNLVPQSEADKALAKWTEFTEPSGFQINIPFPPTEPVRHMAEWEELEAIVITWRSFKDVLVEIVRHAVEEVKVIIVVYNEVVLEAAKERLEEEGISLDNIEFIIRENNTLWVRDYGQTPVYANEVGDLYFIDWIYNRPDRAEDDIVPDAISEELNIPLYSTTSGNYKLVHVGGNFMSDGLGTGFSSELIFDDNGPGNPFGLGPLDEADIDNLMFQYLGIERYIKFLKLNDDRIHHIDLSSHLLDEETWIFGEYPDGVADKAVIEANIEYLQNNFLTPFGTPYDIKRIVMPPDADGKYPDEENTFRTYTNIVFINKTILVPFYEEQYDTIAQNIYEELFPGYKIVGINCSSMDYYYGALHCIIKEIGVKNPLWIVHQKQKNIHDNSTWGGYPLSAKIKHRFGISGAKLFWTTNIAGGYQSIDMNSTVADTWEASIPHQENGTEIFYYIQAMANNGKAQVRPLAAPEGYYHFTVDDFTSSIYEINSVEMQPIYPNPANGITVIPIASPKSIWATLETYDATGKLIEKIFEGNLVPGKNNHFIHAENYMPGIYFIQLKTDMGVASQKLIVR